MDGNSEAKLLVEGFSGNKHESFLTREEADDYVRSKRTDNVPETTGLGQDTGKGKAKETGFKATNKRPNVANAEGGSSWRGGKHGPRSRKSRQKRNTEPIDVVTEAMESLNVTVSVTKR